MKVTATPSRRRRLAPRTQAGRRRLVALGWVAAGLAAGYLASMVIFPAPLVRRATPLARVIGLPEEEAIRRIEAQGFRPRAEERQTDPTVPTGHVLWQDPPPEVELDPGTQVRLTVSDGPAGLVVPDVAEFGFDQAIRVLRAGGFRVGSVDSVAAGQPAGVVLSTRPPAGSSRPTGSGVDLVVSRGPATIRVPNVVGLDRQAARDALEAAGLRVGQVQPQANRRARPGQVLEQRPAAGTLSPRGASISLTIARQEGS